jgi:hypothetical protein
MCPKKASLRLASPTKTQSMADTASLAPISGMRKAQAIKRISGTVRQPPGEACAKLALILIFQNDSNTPGEGVGYAEGAYVKERT